MNACVRGHEVADRKLTGNRQEADRKLGELHIKE
jgi:hypothetical protein